MTIGKRRSTAFKKVFMSNIIRHAMSGIKKEGDDPYDWDAPYIKAFLHKIVLSGNWDTSAGYFKKLTEMFGAFHHDKDFDPEHRMPNYDKRWVRNLKYFKIVLFTDSINYRPPYRIEISSTKNVSPRRYKKLLHRISSTLGNLHVTSIEYAVDLHCYDAESVERLFRTLMRYVHIRHGQGFKALADKIEWGNKTRRNLHIKIGNLKAYERGDDGKKKKDGKKYYWDLENCNRVRIEQTVKKRLLHEQHIDKLDNLLRNAKFFEINEGVYRFKCFEGSRILPQVWEGYKTTDKHGNKNFLQLEIDNYRHKVRNINQYLKDVDALEPLKSTIHNAMRRFDDEWQHADRGHNIYIKIYENENIVKNN